MRVAFAALGAEQLGISMLSAVLRREGHETVLAFEPALFDDRYYFSVPVLRDVFDRGSRVVDEIELVKPDLLAFSVLTPTYRWCLDVAREAKRRLGVPVIFGGVHASAVPEVCLENACVDFVCVGEGEQAIVSLCEALARGDERPPSPIPNLWWRGAGGAIVRGPEGGFVQDLDALPFWDKELWEGSIRIADNWLTMMSRGCPYRCAFCFNNFFAKLSGRGGGKYVRQRSVERCIEELLLAKERFGIRHVDFEDDIFTVDKPWIRTFLERYRREVDRPFACLVHPRYVDREIARWLRDAGCERVQMGVQSADEEYKRKQLLRMEKDSHLKGALEAMAEAGLSVKLDHIVGLPGEPKGAQEKARELYVKYPPARINTFWLAYLPGIELTKSALATGVLTRAEANAIDRGEARLFHHPEAPEAGEGLAGWSDFYQRFDVLFRMLPLLPRPLRERIRAEHLPSMSPRAANAVGFALDLANALLRWDAETLIYARHYAAGVARQLPEVVLGSRLPAKPPKVRPPYGRSSPRPHMGRPEASAREAAGAVRRADP